MRRENQSNLSTRERTESAPDTPGGLLEIDDDGGFSTEVNRRQFLSGSAGVGAGLFLFGSGAVQAKEKSGAETHLSAGQLHLTLKDVGDGVHVQSLYDEVIDRELLAERAIPLWEIAMLDPESVEGDPPSATGYLRADQGWEATSVSRGSGAVEMTWRGGELTIPAGYGIPNETITMDGNLTELSDIPSLSISEDFTQFAGSYSNSGDVGIAWDADNFYVIADLADDDHVQIHDGPKTWHDDCIQLGLSAGEPGEADEWDQLDIALTDDGPQVYRRVFPEESVSEVMQSADASIVRENGHTKYEIALPWSDLTVDAADEVVSLSVAVHDRDDNHDTNTGWFQWGDGLLGGKDPSGFKRAELVTNEEDAGPGLQNMRRIDDISVTARVESETDQGAFHWDIGVENDSEWSVLETAFPQISLGKMEGGELFFPALEGYLESDPWDDFTYGKYRMTYPAGTRAAMQYFSAYDSAENGLYFGLHDPHPTVKNFFAGSPTEERGLVLRFFQPAEDMIEAGNDFELSGEGVWQLQRGNWFDAAMIYRDWVRENASWYPELGPDGREDTPEWMKEVATSLRFPTRESTNQGMDAQISRAKRYQEFMDVPVRAHWYRWQQNVGGTYRLGRVPFNFPPKEGFAEAVEELQENDIHVMPYVNSRLWDDDYDGFATEGKPGALKDPDGDVYTEFGDAVMDPSTETWQDALHDVAIRLFDEYGVDAVYFDQLAGPAYMHTPAAPPHINREFGDVQSLGFDADHGHPLGGGHWWIDGYRDLLENIRANMPDDGALTIENGAEMYTAWSDGGLVFPWGKRSDQDPVPAYPAVYGGAYQLFGRAPRGWRNDKYDPMFRVKAAEMLVYGNQIGWLPPNIIEEKPKKFLEYLRATIRLRYQLTRYFSAGQMARPVELDVPDYTVDWRHKNNRYPVTRDAVRTNTWEQPDEDKVVFIFTNPSEDAVTTNVNIDLKEYDMYGRTTVQKIGPDGPTDESFTTVRSIDREVTFDAETAWAWEVIPEDEEAG